MQLIVRSAGQGEGGQVVMVLSHLAATQPHLTELPKSVIKVSIFSGSDYTERSLPANINERPPWAFTEG